MRTDLVALGWDPATGLGLPNFDDMLKVALRGVGEQEKEGD